MPDDDGFAEQIAEVGSLFTAGRSAEAYTLARSLLDHLDPVRSRAERIRVLSWLGPVGVDSGHVAEGMAHAEELIELAAGEPSEGLVTALCLRGVVRTRLRMENEGLADLRTAAELARPGLLPPDTLFNALAGLAYSSVGIGLYESAERYCMEAEALSEHASPVAAAHLLASWAWLHTEWAVALVHEGDRTGADRHVQRVDELVEEIRRASDAVVGPDPVGQDALAADGGTLRALVAAWQGRADEALAILDGLPGAPTVRPGNNPLLTALLARALALRTVGDPDGVVRCATEMREMAELFRADRWDAESHRLVREVTTDPAVAAAATERFEALVEGLSWQQRLRPLQLLPREGFTAPARRRQRRKAAAPAPVAAADEVADHADDGPVEDLDARIGTIGSLVTAGRSAEALVTAEPLLERLDPVRDRSARIAVLSWLGPACLDVGRVPDSVAFTDELIALAGGEPSSALASALCVRGVVRIRSRREDEGLADLRAAHALTRPGVLGAEDLFAALTVLASGSVHVGLFEAAERYCVLADALAGHGTPVAIAYFIETRAWLHAEWALALDQEGDAEGGAQHMWRVGELAEDVHRAAAAVLERDKLGHDVLSVDAEALRALAVAWRGGAREALETLDGLREQPSTRPGHNPALAAALARPLAHRALGDDAGAAGPARAAAELAARSGADRWQAEAHRILRDVAPDPVERRAAAERYRALVEGVGWQRRLRSLPLAPPD